MIDRRDTRGLVGGLLCVLGVSLSGCGRDSEPSSILLVTLDTTRADRLGCYGHEIAHTPTLDSLAAGGAVFERAMASTPVTLPSHSSILTGVGPGRHGVRDNGIFTLSESFETLAERLGAEGYQTGAFISAFVLSRPYGTAQGFTTYDDLFYNERPAHLTTRKAVRWLDRIDPEKPFLLWVHYYDPHMPLEPIEPYRSLEGLDLYDQEIAAMDAGLGALMSALRDRGLAGRTHVMVVGDHGEGNGDHGELEHGLFLYDSTMRIPLILTPHASSGSLARKAAGTRVTQVASTIDVTPTLLAMAGLEIGDQAEGIDLTELLEDGRASEEQRWVYGETYFAEYNFYHSHIFSLTSRRWKYVDAPRPELYDLLSDEGEWRDRITDLPDTAAAIKDHLDALRETWSGEGNDKHTLTAEDIERLQSLGYLAGGDVALSMSTSEEFILPDPKELRGHAEAFTRGLQMINDGRHDEAIEQLEAVLAHNPENLIARLNLGRLLTGLGRTDQAIHHLREAIVLSPKSATSRKFLGVAYQKAGRYEESVATLEEIRFDPMQGATALRELARTQLLMGRLEDAQLTLRSLADRMGGSPEYMKLAERVGVLIETRFRLEQTPEDEELRFQAAGAALDVQLLREAEAYLDFTASTPRREADRRRLMGSVAGARGDSETALREFEAVLDYYPRDIYVRTQLTGLYLDAGDPERTVLLVEELIREGRPHPVLYYNKACALGRLGRVDEALIALRTAVNRGYDNHQNLQEDPDLDALREDPRYFEILETMGEGAAG